MTDEPQILERRVEALEKAVEALERQAESPTPADLKCVCGHSESEHDDDEGMCLSGVPYDTCDCSDFIVCPPALQTQRDKLEEGEKEPPPDDFEEAGSAVLKLAAYLEREATGLDDSAPVILNVGAESVRRWAGDAVEEAARWRGKLREKEAELEAALKREPKTGSPAQPEPSKHPGPEYECACEHFMGDHNLWSPRRCLKCACACFSQKPVLEKSGGEETPAPQENKPTTDTCTCGHRRVEHKDGYCLHGVPDEGCPCTRYELRGLWSQEGLDLGSPPEPEPPVITCPRCLCAGAKAGKWGDSWALCPHCKWNFPTGRAMVHPPCVCGHNAAFHFEDGFCSGIADSEPCACRLYRRPSEPVEGDDPAPTQRLDSAPSEAPTPIPATSPESAASDGPGYTPAELFAELDRVVSGPPNVVESTKSWRAMNRLVAVRWVESHKSFGWSVIAVTELGASVHEDVFGTEGK